MKPLDEQDQGGVKPAHPKDLHPPAALLHQVKAYIEDHIDEPDLDPATVAAAQDASVRLAYKRVAAQGETVAVG